MRTTRRYTRIRRHLRFGLAVLAGWTLAACPPAPPDGGLPTCEELACGGGAVCLDGACRSWACADLACAAGQVCQGGPLCLDASAAVAPACDTLACDAGTVCQGGPLCRGATEDLDGDGVASQLDCDDGNALRLPGNAEVCDGLDNDCDGTSDEDAPCPDGTRCCGAAGCVDPTSNREHCGGCANACAIYEECDDGDCREADAPVVDGVTPDPLVTGQWLGLDDVPAMVITGRHLLGYATVYIESSDGVSAADPFEVVGAVNGGAYSNDQPILIDGAKLPAGSATIRLARNDGAESDPFPILVAGAQVPEVTSVSPDPAPMGEEISFSAYGTGFWGQPELLLAQAQDEPIWMRLPVLWVTDTWIRTDIVVLDPALHSPGDWLAKVRNPDDSESAPCSFVVEPAPAPQLTGLNPTSAQAGAEVTLTIYGFGMFGTPSVVFAPEADPEHLLPPVPVALVDSRRIVTEPFVLAPDLFPAQPYLVWVANPDEASSNRLRFVVFE